jgi:glycosyltransferase involved in cell wall biosynthesis
MRIGIVLSTTSDISLGVIVRTMELASSLAEIGVEIHVISPSNDDLNRAKGVVKHRIGKRLSCLKYLKIAGNVQNRLLRNPATCRTIMLRPFVLERAIDSFSKDLYVVVKGLNLDILQGEQEIAAAACARVGEKLGIHSVASLHNILHEEQKDSKTINESDAAYIFINGLYRRILQDSDLTLVLSEGMQDYFVQNCAVPKEKISIVPLSSKARVDHIEYEENPSRIVHAGLASYLDRIRLFVESVPIVRARFPAADFYLTRKGESLREIRCLEMKYKTALNYFWFPEANDFYDFLKSCHVGIVTSQDCMTRRVGYAMKFFDYMACGIPVVANDISGWTKIIREKGVGILTGPTPKDFARGTMAFLEDPDFRYKCAQNALNLAKTDYNIESIALRLSEKYQALGTRTS